MTDQTKITTEAEAVSNLALAAQGVVPVEVLDVNGVHYAFTKDPHGGVKQTRLKAEDDHGNLTEAPARVVQRVNLETADSIVVYLKDYKSDGSRLFANIGADTIVGVIDYHEGRLSAVADLGGAESVSADHEAKADFTDHRATLKLARSEEWKTWTAQDGQLMDHLAFARFLYENKQDVKDPSGADLLDIVRDLRGTRLKKFTGDMNLNASGTSFEYEDKAQVSAKESVTIPETFRLFIPVYFDGAKVEVTAQLRHDVDEGGRLFLGFKLMRPEYVRQSTFMDVVRDVEDRSGVPAVYGQLTA